MDLPVMPPTSPMLAKLARALPAAKEGTRYEPKWDGFRAIVYRDGGGIEIESRGEKSLARYFPELVEPLLLGLPQRVVVDGEIVVAGPSGLDFNLLQQRIHPAESRIYKLAAETPASYVAFDLLALGDRDLRPEPFGERRRLLEGVTGSARAPLHLTPATEDRSVAEEWLDRFVGSGLDGVMVKDPAQIYQEGKRVLIKVKRERTAEGVVAGYRLHKDGHGVGSMLLGIHDGRGVLHHTGVVTGFAERARVELLGILRPYEMDGFEGHPWEGWSDPGAHERQLMPGTPSRWSGARPKEVDWVPLRPELVAEVHYEHLQGARFRHPARFARWRPDREPASCTYAQLVTPAPADLALFLSDRFVEPDAPQSGS